MHRALGRSLLLQTAVLISIAQAPAAQAASGDIAHPFLVVKPAEIAGLRARASQSPYSGMKAAAKTSAAQSLPAEATTDANVRGRALLLNEIMSSASLSYLLEADTTLRQTYRNKIIEQMSYWDPNKIGSLSAHYLLANPPLQSWDYMTPTSAAFFQSVLALDVIYNDISVAQRQSMEGWLAVPGNFYTQRRINWVTAGLGARGLWALYSNNRTVADTAKYEYLDETEATISVDGVFMDGTGYAIARWFNPDREQKSSFGDVLAYLHEIPDDRWYSNPRFVKFQEWINGYSFAPSRDSWGVGDAGVQHFASWMKNAQRSGRFSVNAGAYERWLKSGFTPGGRITAYIFTDIPQGAVAKAAPSRIFPSGGAYFRQITTGAGDSADLAGVLHNVQYEGDYNAHMHKETNAVYLAGYGAVLMGGAGYNSWGQSFGGFAWEYINRRAVSGNVALIDYDLARSGGTIYLPSTVNDHRDTEIDHTGNSKFGGDGKFGGGVHGLVTGSVDVATGTTAGARNGGVALDALPNGNHLRHFFFVQPADGKGGYFASIDQIAANAGYQALSAPLSAHTVWHPNGSQVASVTANAEYEWQIDAHPELRLSVFLGTAPSTTALLDGALADRLVGKYLFATYPADANRRAQAVTVMYPHVAVSSGTSPHPKATFTRLTGSGFSAARVDSGGGVIDTIAESRGDSVVAPQADVTFRGAGVLYRRLNTALSFYIAVRARSFRLGTAGFSSSTDISFFNKNKTGKVDVATGGASVTLFRPGVKGIRINGQVSGSAVLGNGQIQVNFPAGTSDFELLDDLIYASSFE